MSKFQNLENYEYCDKYASIARKLKYASKRAGEYSFIFNTLSKLAAVLSIRAFPSLKPWSPAPPTMADTTSRGRLPA